MDHITIRDRDGNPKVSVAIHHDGDQVSQVLEELVIEGIQGTLASDQVEIDADPDPEARA